MFDKYKEIDGTYYHKTASPEVIKCIEQARKANAKIAIDYGDQNTGETWGDTEEGYIGRSIGPIKVPIIKTTKKSLDGFAISDNCVVRIKNCKDESIIWQHPNFKPA